MATEDSSFDNVVFTALTDTSIDLLGNSISYTVGQFSPPGFFAPPGFFSPPSFVVPPPACSCDTVTGSYNTHDGCPGSLNCTQVCYTYGCSTPCSGTCSCSDVCTGSCSGPNCGP